MTREFRRVMFVGVGTLGVYALGYFLMLLGDVGFTTFVYYIYGGAAIVCVVFLVVVVWSIWKFVNPKK